MPILDIEYCIKRKIISPLAKIKVSSIISYY